MLNARLQRNLGQGAEVVATLMVIFFVMFPLVWIALASF